MAKTNFRGDDNKRPRVETKNSLVNLLISNSKEHLFLKKKFQKKNFLEKVILTKISAGEISVCTIAEMRLFRILLLTEDLSSLLLTDLSKKKFCPIPFSVLLPNQNSFQNIFVISASKFQKCQNLWDSRNFDNAKSWAWRDDVRCDVIFTDNTPTGENKGAEWTA